ILTASAFRPASVIRPRAASTVLLADGDALGARGGEPGADKLDHLLKAPSRARSRAPREGSATACIETIGAGEGNRTLVISLEGCCSTIELHPRQGALIGDQ